jgi:prevent-host-death family protein
MQKVGSRELKNRLGRYLRAVRAGQSLIITSRGKSVAKLAPPDDATLKENGLMERLKELEARGLIRLAKGRLGKFRAVKIKGKPASQTIIEDRR